MTATTWNSGGRWAALLSDLPHLIRLALLRAPVSAPDVALRLCAYPELVERLVEVRIEGDHEVSHDPAAIAQLRVIMPDTNFLFE